MNKNIFSSSFSDSFAEYMDHCEACLAADSYQHRRVHVVSFDRYLAETGFQGEEITEPVVLGWIGSLAPLSGKTIATYVSSIRQLFEYLSARGAVKAYMPTIRHVEDLYIPHYYSDDELDRLYKLIDDYPCGDGNTLPYIKAEFPMIVRMLESTGARLGETLSIQMKDVDLDRGVVTMANAKAGKERLVPLSGSLLEILKKYCTAMGIGGNPDAYLFPRDAAGGKMYGQLVAHKFRMALKWAGISSPRRQTGRRAQRGMCLHCFRHCFAVRSFRQMESQGMHLDDAIPYLSIYLGHRGLNETEKYLKFSAEMFPDEMQRFDRAAESAFPSDDVWDEYLSLDTEQPAVPQGEVVR